MNIRILQDEGFDERYIAFVDHTDQAKSLKRDNPQIARVNACLAKAVMEMFAHAGVAIIELPPALEGTRRLRVIEPLNNG